MSDHDTYYANAQSWADERVEAERRARRLAWIVAGVAAAIAVLLAILLVMLLPLKTVQPYVVTVDRQTGGRRDGDDGLRRAADPERGCHSG